MSRPATLLVIGIHREELAFGRAAPRNGNARALIVALADGERSGSPHDPGGIAVWRGRCAVTRRLSVRRSAFRCRGPSNEVIPETLDLVHALVQDGHDADVAV